jgi:hypothetical protein
MIQAIPSSLPTLSKSSVAAGGTGFEQVLQELPSLGKIAEAAGGGFLAGGPVGAAVSGGLALLHAALGAPAPPAGDQVTGDTSVVLRAEALLKAYDPLAHH